MERTGTSLKWARNGAILALVLSALALVLPSRMTGYNDWADWHLAVYNIAAIAVRVVVFAAVGAALGGVWSYFRRRGHHARSAARR